jgi:NAD(P)-dependent dehydrogenase (short-subunit alcohol dehydrogenase family)
MSVLSSPDGQLEPRPSTIYPEFFERLPSMTGKTVAVTGASRGLGYVTAMSLAKKGALVLMLNRDSVRATAAHQAISASATGPPPINIACDLLDFASVRRAAHQVCDASNGQLDVLCLNAGIMMQPDQPSTDGYDITIATNVLSHFLLAREVMPALRMAASTAGEARVVSMSSASGFGPPAFDASFFAREGGRLGGARLSYERYHQSKLSNLIFTSALHERMQTAGVPIKAVACHPGVCATDMFVHVTSLSRPGQPADVSRVPSAEDGACAQLLCVCSPSVRSGQLWGPSGMGGPPGQIELAPPTVLLGNDERRKLWECCERAVGEFAI